jgi:drug/metabolite transporter superfamily protein YnfA
MIRGLAILVCAALLESGGDALIRLGLERRISIIVCGAFTLTIYGIMVNQSSLDFGRLMGCYIAVFFVVSQLIALIFFHQTPSTRTLLGGALIVGGGLAIFT